ncbi:MULTISPECIES: hypothetical protein [unclassified Kribbella]|uniref:hypothetical protein n=1 Tax=unclassified Kribbella TaxID=2644121 RepID=UPI0030164B6A
MADGEFAMALRRRVREAQLALEQARAEGDSYAVDIRTGELDSLLHSASENGVDLGELHDAAGQGGDR